LKDRQSSKSFAEKYGHCRRAERREKMPVPTITVGRTDPAAARIAIAVAGINCTELVLIGERCTSHSKRPFGVGQRFQIAHRAQSERRRGVASPSMFAAMFINIEPIADGPGGTSGTIAASRPQSVSDPCTRPARSANALLEPQRHHSPHPIAIVTAVFGHQRAAGSRLEPNRSQPPIATASNTSASQI